MSDRHTGYHFLHGTVRRPKCRRVMARYKLSNLRIVSHSKSLELDTPNVASTDAYDRKPLVPPNARELYENVILSEFPEDPMPMPSEHLLELIFEYAALKARTRPNTLHTLHPSVLLSTAMIVNDYIKEMLTPSVLEHVNRCLDAEEAEEAAMAEPVNAPRDHVDMGEYEDYVDADEQAEDAQGESVEGSDIEAMIKDEEKDSTELPSTYKVPRWSIEGSGPKLKRWYQDFDEQKYGNTADPRTAPTGDDDVFVMPQAPIAIRSKRASAHAAVAKMSGVAPEQRMD